MAQPADNLHSAETLRLLGLSEDIAKRIYEKQWRGSPQEEGGRDFCRFAKNGLSEYTYCDKPIDMRQSLRNLVGAGSALVDQIMAPGFDGVRETQTAWYWVKEAMDMRWESLQRDRELNTTEAAPSAVAVPRNGNEQGGGGEIHVPSRPPPGTLRLWKATSRVRAKNMWNDPMLAGEGFRIQPLMSNPGQDFNPRSMAYHLIPNLDDARTYTRFMSHWVGDAGVCLVSIDVPINMIDETPRYILHFPSPEWKRVVSRRGTGLSTVCLQAYQAELLVGDVATGAEVAYGRMKSPDEVTELNVLKNEKGEKICQYVCVGDLESVVDENPSWCTVWDHETLTELSYGR